MWKSQSPEQRQIDEEFIQQEGSRGEPLWEKGMVLALQLLQYYLGS